MSTYPRHLIGYKGPSTVSNISEVARALNSLGIVCLNPQIFGQFGHRDGGAKPIEKEKQAQGYISPNYAFMQ